MSYITSTKLNKLSASYEAAFFFCKGDKLLSNAEHSSSYGTSSAVSAATSRISLSNFELLQKLRSRGMKFWSRGALPHHLGGKAVTPILLWEEVK